MRQLTNSRLYKRQGLTNCIIHYFDSPSHLFFGAVLQLLFQESIKIKFRFMDMAISFYSKGICCSELCAQSCLLSVQ